MVDNCNTCAPFDTVPIEELFNDVRPYCAMAPDDLVAQAVRHALVEFARRTLVLQRDLYVDLQAGVRDYSVVAPDRYVIHMIREVSTADQTFTAMQRPPLQCMPPCTFFFEPPCSLLIGHEPQEDKREGLRVRATVIPSSESCYVDAYLYDMHGETIATGALSRLMLMPKEEWYDTRQGGIMLTRWREALKLAKVERAKNLTAGPVYIKERRII